ncbi:hypothetical protein FBUS_08834 [Fasciolopsis buskii]|uniref:Uncharacterized protein n=1 Tax=Fasciolopsis buskii TaxID=27845 RepID=A0A8E0RSU9_9TREM|nr:hypothetical protein FBUS_08834 [Fasciolopsis buski]
MWIAYSLNDLARSRSPKILGLSTFVFSFAIPTVTPVLTQPVLSGGNVSESLLFNIFLLEVNRMVYSSLIQFVSDFFFQRDDMGRVIQSKLGVRPYLTCFKHHSFGFLLFPTTQHQTAYLSEVRICFSWNLSYIDCQYKQSHVVDITLTSNDLCPDEFIFPPWTTTWTYFCRFVYGLLGLISFCVLLRLLLS